MKCEFVGYSTTQKGYICWSQVEKRLLVSIDVHFRESESYYKQEISSAFDDLIETENMRERDNGEGLLNLGLIPLLIPIPTEKQVSWTMMKKKEKKTRNLYVLELKLRGS